MSNREQKIQQLTERELIKRGFSAAELTGLAAFGRMKGGIGYGRGSTSSRRNLAGPCYVYMLVSPVTQLPFYIGISSNPWDRFSSHRHDKFSAAYHALKEIFEDAKVHRDDVLKIHKKCETRNDAFELEYLLVTTTSGLLNRPYKKGRAY